MIETQPEYQLIVKLSRMASDAIDKDERGLFDTCMKGIEVMGRVMQYEREDLTHRFRVREMEALGMAPTPYTFDGVELTVWAKLEKGKLAANTPLFVFAGSVEITKLVKAEVWDEIIYTLNGEGK